MTGSTLLVVAKAPVPGLAKTRIARTVGDDTAAALAAAALLDTLVTVTAVGLPVVVAMTGDLSCAVREAEITAALSATRVVEQRGEGFGERLAHAHADADAGHGVVQVGMDTPQITADDWFAACDAVGGGSRVIGPAADGGWWLLGLPNPAAAHVLADVPMSREDTCVRTESAIGCDFVRLRELRDMDTWQDALAIAHQIRISHLADAVRSIEACA